MCWISCKHSSFIYHTLITFFISHFTCLSLHIRIHSLFAGWTEPMKHWNHYQRTKNNKKLGSNLRCHEFFFFGNLIFLLYMNETLWYSVLNRVYLQIYGKEKQKLFWNYWWSFIMHASKDIQQKEEKDSSKYTPMEWYFELLNFKTIFYRSLPCFHTLYSGTFTTT